MAVGGFPCGVDVDAALGVWSGEENTFFWLSMANWVRAKKAAEFSFDAS